MSLFDKDIVTKDLSWMNDGRDWMLEHIRIAVNGFLNSPRGRHIMICDDDAGVMWNIAGIVRCVWLDNSDLLKQFNIDATCTMIHHSRTKGYKYDVVVDVRFISHDLEDYVEFIRVPIIKL